MQVKDGVSWTALEYYKWLQTQEGPKFKVHDLVVVPCSLVYTDKSRYRSSAVVEYVGTPF
jgi:glycerol-3-phosphate O-acyltransferase/dihydroxyacetone phosphate acyltransferase